ncbi:MAG: molecular chaperone HtpG [Spirochaetia bacterium]|jgi:molecular chaperone HtpG|nr:molecular chaperone HtpG [Spirochaetia bacterium]
MSKKKFKTEVSQLLHLIIHSLYSHKEIFLRELVSNASDALDKLKYLTLTDDNYKKLKFDPRIDIKFEDGDKKKLIITDSGIGMNEEDLDTQLGTIARSGTKNFLNTLSGDEKKDANLIGQFGVGFYSSFMIADKVEVLTQKAGEETAWLWTSDGENAYSIKEAEKESYGTKITLHLNEEGNEYASRWSLESLVKKYSDHIAFPIFLEYEDSTWEGEGDDKKEKKEIKIEQVNAASALWKKSKSELNEEDYNEFYKTIGHDNEDPLLYIHTKAEGTLEYTTLFYIPKKAPFDMFQADYKAGVKLYVSRIFITDDEKELMPTYLRFLRGIIDSEDLPLNVSREILQKNKVLTNIKNSSVKKVLSELQKLSEGNQEKYIEFIEQYNRPLKEGLYSDFANRDALLELIRFKSTEIEGHTSLAAYKERMKDDQKSIYYITGENEDTLRNSPLIEGYVKKGIEVLIMSDEIDEIVIPSIGTYKETELKSVNKSGTADDFKSDSDEETEKKVEPLLKKIKDALGDKVKDVVASKRLSDSPSCIVADENDPTVQMQQMLKAMGQGGAQEVAPILEVNPTHEIVEKLESVSDEDFIKDVSFLLLEQAMLMEGAELKKPAEFVKRLNRVLTKAL